MTLTPLMRRLLNKPLLSRGQLGLVMSLRKRERVMRTEKESADFSAEHPWWVQIHGQDREVIRRIIGSLCDTGRRLQARRFQDVICCIGDWLGPKVIWPLLSHLLDGGIFDCFGIEIIGGRPNTKNLPPVPLEQFLEQHLPADTSPDRLYWAKALLKAWAHMEEMVKRFLEGEVPATEAAVSQQASGGL